MSLSLQDRADHQAIQCRNVMNKMKDKDFVKEMAKFRYRSFFGEDQAASADAKRHLSMRASTLVPGLIGVLVNAKFNSDV